jgi:transposase
MDEVAECPGCRKRDQAIAELQAIVAAQQVQIAVLQAEVASLARKLDERPQPPRGHAGMPPAPAKKPTGRKRGAQPGHPPHLKELVPAERVDQIISLVPDVCSGCRADLSAVPTDLESTPLRHQIAELPRLAARITEYQAHARTCPDCGRLNRATIPASIRRHCLGERLTAVLAYLVGSHGVSKRGVEEIAHDVFGVQIALGSVANLEQEVSAALEPAHQEAMAHVRAGPVKHLDETGWKQAGKKRWLWVAATSTVAVFLIDRLRNAVALSKLLGTAVAGVLCSDRWRAYDEHPLERRQLCWAHLKRNFEKLFERGGKAKEVAKAALDVTRRVFDAWHRYRGGGSHRAFDETIAPLMLELLGVLQSGLRSRDARLKRFCARLLAQYPAMWTFVVIDGVEPTNNHAERVLRRAVLWRRRSFGCQSDAGCRFAERVLTAVQSLRLQGRSVVAFLQESLAAQRAGLGGPSLIAVE